MLRQSRYYTFGDEAAAVAPAAPAAPATGAGAPAEGFLSRNLETILVGVITGLVSTLIAGWMFRPSARG